MEYNINYRTIPPFDGQVKIIDKPIRRYDDIPGRAPYQLSRQYALDCCHIGQRKLFWAEFEFLTIISKYIDVKTCLIVYIGSAPGTHLKHLIRKYFPDTSWLLYDPRKFDVEDVPATITFKSGKEGFFTSEKINDVLKIASGRKIIYINDMRIDGPTEESILDESLKQQSWGVKMDAEFMLLKMRIPYSSDYKILEKISNYDASDILDKVIIKNPENKSNKKFLYLSGPIYLQVFTPSISAETRLLVSKIKYQEPDNCNEEKYYMTYWDRAEYEERMTYFNLITRNLTYSYRESESVLPFILGHDYSYASVTEYILLGKYYKRFDIPATHHRFMKDIMEIDIFFNYSLSNNLITGTLSNLLEYDKKTSITSIIQLRFLSAIGIYHMTNKSIEYQLSKIKNKITENDQLSKLVKKHLESYHHRIGNIGMRNNKLYISQELLDLLEKVSSLKDIQTL